MTEPRDTPKAGVDIGICTFRREGIADTLASLAGQGEAAGVRLRVIVADNDDTPTARPIVESAAAAHRLNLLYVHAPARNISLARNATLDAGDGDWIAFIDDDERAEPGWLAALLARALETDADVVLGPVLPVYGPGAPEWMRAGAFHAARPVVRNGGIETGYAGNALVRRSVVETERFRLDLGRSGGEDTEFFARLWRRGARIVEAPDAVVSETVPQDRATLGWLLRRRYRSGQTHAALAILETGSRGRLPAAGLAAMKAAACLCGATIRLPNAERRAFWLLRGALHAGVISRLFGHSELEQYGGAAAHAPAPAPPRDS